MKKIGRIDFQVEYYNIENEQQALIEHFNSLKSAKRHVNTLFSQGNIGSAHIREIVIDEKGEECKFRIHEQCEDHSWYIYDWIN